MQEIESLAKKHAVEHWRLRGRGGSPRHEHEEGEGERDQREQQQQQHQQHQQDQQDWRDQDFESRDCGQESLEFEKIVETYKLLIIPDKTLRTYLLSLGKENAKKEFRRIALLVHPDKNSHPNSKLAFQKLYNHFVNAMAGST